MIGIIAGDIIGSPYRKNPRPDTASIFFDLFSSSDRVEINPDRRTARTVSFEAKPTILTDLAEAAADWYLNTGRTGEEWSAVAEARLRGRRPDGAEALAVCGPLAELSGGENEAIRHVGTLMDRMGSAEDVAEAAVLFVRILREVRDRTEEDVLKKTLLDAGYEAERSASEMRPFLSGAVIRTENGKLGLGDGLPVRAPSEVVPAVWAAFIGSDSYEEAVRRASAMGGDSSLTAALAGALAEMRWEVPGHIRSRAMDYLPEADRTLMNTLERVRKGKETLVDEEEREKVRTAESNGTRFSVIRMEGHRPVYVIPEGRKDIEAAVKAVNRRLGSDYEVVRPEAADDRMREMEAQLSPDGTPLDGTYVEHPRPELKPVWFQEGAVRSAVTRTGDGVNGRRLPKKETRMDTFNEFRKLKDYAEKIRTELERLAGFEGGGRHLHFASALYPVVLDQSIELWQGDILRGRVGIDADGRFSVDACAPTGGVHTEGLEGVLATMNLFEGNANMADVRLLLDRYCLDYGAIPDEAEREALEAEDADADSVRRKYRSNVETALKDMPADLEEAVMPVRSERDERAAQVREELRQESAERYRGMTRTEVLDSQAHRGSVFTVGHSNLSRDEFDALLRRHGIEVLVDVRTYTKSRYCPHFDKDRISGYMEDKGIEYHHLPELGGHRYEGEGSGRRRLSYEECIARKEFQRSLKAVRDCVREGYRVALMGAESDPLDSHRSVMLGRALAHPEIYDRRLKPMDVQHIIRQGYCLSQEYLENRMMKLYVPSDGRDDDPGRAKERLTEAFRRKGEFLVNRKDQPKRISLRQEARKNDEGPKRQRRGPKR